MSKNEIAKKIRSIINSDPHKDFIQSISLFGSFFCGKQNSQSDIDLFFEMRKPMSLFKITAMQNRLEERLGQKIDFIEINSLDKYIKNDIINNSEKIYDQK